MEKTHETETPQPPIGGKKIQPGSIPDESNQRRPPANAGWLPTLKARAIYGVALIGYAVILTTYVAVYIWLATLLWTPQCSTPEANQSSTKKETRDHQQTTR